MLKIKHKHHLNLPHFDLNTKPMQLSPITTENDELVQAIDADKTERENNWELNERPDLAELDKFWSEVEADVANDPEWFKFND